MTTQDLIEYYVDLLIMQYATQPNAQATIAAFVAQEINDQIYTTVASSFNFALSPIGIQPDSAIGVQLNAIATYRGAQRIYYGFAGNNYYEWADAQDMSTYANPGMMDAADPSAVTWYFLTAENTQQPIYSLSDAQLYMLTQFRALTQSSFLSIEDIDDILFEFFGNNVALVDNENMTILYVALTSDSDPFFGICAISQSLPRPAGVLAQAIRADTLTDWFGFQDSLVGYNPSFAGYSDSNITPTPGTFISAP